MHLSALGSRAASPGLSVLDSIGMRVREAGMRVKRSR